MFTVQLTAPEAPANTNRSPCRHMRARLPGVRPQRDDCVHADALADVAGGHRQGHGGDVALDRGVQRAVRDADDGDHRARVDDRGVRGPAQVRERGAADAGQATMLTSSTRCHSSSSFAVMSPAAPMPASLMTISSDPKCSTTDATAEATSSERDTSQATGNWSSGTLSAVRSSTATRAPRSVGTAAVAAPDPQPPVIGCPRATETPAMSPMPARMSRAIRARAESNRSAIAAKKRAAAKSSVVRVYTSE